MAKRTAVIDIGSNSVRMVIYEKTSRYAFHLLHEIKSPVRIGEGAYENALRLQEAPMERAIAAIGEFLSITRAYGVRKILCVATSAVRDAPNRYDFLQRIRTRLKLHIKVIDGEKEAYFGGIAAANLLPSVNGATIDIGGGSTECATIKNGAVIDKSSLKIGTVRLKELFFDKGAIKEAKTYIDERIATLPIANDTVIGIGGTFRALAKIIMADERYALKKLHAFRFNAKKLAKLAEKIVKADDNELKKIGIKKERFDVIRPGALVLLRIIKRFDIKYFITSGVGVREGVYLHDLLRSSNAQFPAAYNPSVRMLVDKFQIDTKLANLHVKVAKELFTLLREPFAIDKAYEKPLLIAAKLLKIGASLHFYSNNRHGYYLIETALEYGFSHEDIVLIATLVRYHKKKSPSKEHMERFAALLPQKKVLERLTQIISLCDILLTHHPRSIDFSLQLKGDVLAVIGTTPLYLVSERLKSFECDLMRVVTLRA